MYNILTGGDMTSIEKKNELYKLVKAVLIENGITSRDNRLKADKIIELIQAQRNEDFSKLDIKVDNFSAMLSMAIKNQETTEIIRPEGAQGYFIAVLSKEVQKEIDKVEIDESKKEESERNKEKILYKPFEKWLRENGNRADDTSSNRIMGRWGNPDVTGIKIITDYGLNEIEVTTIEVKLNGIRWEYDIFEAIAHRRFANQCFLAFAVDGDSKSNYSRNRKLAYYSSLYEVGVLLLSLSTINYQKLLEGKLKSIDEEDESFDIIELLPAKYHQINLEYKRQFLESIGVEKDQKMYRWGKDPIE
jgi:hypothetical protein